MATTLLLIRHGETPWNLEGRVQGCTDIDLSNAGRLQAKLLADRLKGNFDAVYSSPLNRAFETGEILCQNTKHTPTKIQDLIEVNFGSWEGLTFPEIKESYLEHYTKWRTDEQVGPMYDGEKSIQNVARRAKNCITELIKKHPDETIVIVSHGGFIKSALIGLLDLKTNMYHKFTLGNTCITTLRFDEELNPVLLGLNDTCHLRGEKTTTV